MRLKKRYNIFEIERESKVDLILDTKIEVIRYKKKGRKDLEYKCKSRMHLRIKRKSKIYLICRVKSSMDLKGQ
jgi:hypothetical protein